MRTIIFAATLASSFIVGCGGGSSGGNSDGGGGNGSSGGSSISGSCSALGTTYTFHWTYVSGGTTCQQQVPPDSTSGVDIDAGFAMVSATADAGGCPTTVSGCNYSATCSIPFGDAGSEQISETASVAANGSISGTLTIVANFSFGGTTVREDCVYSLTGTKQ